MGAPAQDVVNRRVVDNSDVLVAFFWTRLGTPTTTGVSGTGEELKRVLDAGKPAALFMSRRPADPHAVDPEQFASLKAILDTQRGNGLVMEFQTPEELSARVTDSLTRVVHERFVDSQFLLQPRIPEAVADVRALHLGLGSDSWVVVRNVGSVQARDVILETVDATGNQVDCRIRSCAPPKSPSIHLD